MENKLIRKTNKFMWRNRKRLQQSLKPRPAKQSILFILGCQRSGTSIIERVFDKDLNTQCYDEFSVLSSNDVPKGIRLNPLDLVKKEFSKVRAPFIVLKPLVESQNALELLDYFDNSKAVWMFRNYRGVASSNIKYFGLRNGIDDIRPIAKNEPNNWRSEKVSGWVRETISKHFSENMNPYDAAVLFWFARNSLFFDLGLDANPRVMMCYYEDLVLDPEKYVRSIYQQAGQVYPEINITTEVHSNSRKKGKDLELSPEIEQLAQELLDKLEVAYRAKSTALMAS
jgi:hypothetical protein